MTPLELIGICAIGLLGFCSTVILFLGVLLGGRADEEMPRQDAEAVPPRFPARRQCHGSRAHSHIRVDHERRPSR